MSDAQIFQVFSIAYLAIGLGIVINPQFYKSIYEDFIERTSVLYIGGVSALVIGYLIVTFHGQWTKDMSVIITVIGWLALVKGISILVCPKLMIAMMKRIIKKQGVLKLQAIIVIIFGLALAFLGFCPKCSI
jgi:drug/metabolite transporter (DMT)-like permease